MSGKDPRNRTLAGGVATFVGLAVVGMVVLYFALAHRQGLLTPKAEITLLARSGRGFLQGQPVELSGFAIGRVKSISLEAIDRVHVVVTLERDSLRWIRADSTARLVKPDILADSVVEIIPGSAVAPPVLEGGSIRFERGHELTGGADTVLAEAASVLIELRGVLVQMRGEGELGEAVENLSLFSERFLEHEAEAYQRFEQVFDRLDVSVRHWDEVIGHADETFGRFDRSLQHTDRTLDGVDEVTSGLRGRMPEFLGRIETSLANLERASAVIRDAAEARAPEVEDLLVESDRLVREARVLVEAIQQVWPIRTHVPPRETDEE